MDALYEILYSIPLLAVTIVIEYRLSTRVLDRKYSKICTFSVMLAVNILAGWLNLHFHIAADFMGTAYYGLIVLALYLVLFKDDIIKKVFLTVLIRCLPITYYIFLPFAHHFFRETTDDFLFALKVLEIANTLLCALTMEYIGKKFQNLHRQFPVDYTLYLTAVILFVHVAIYSAYDRMLMINEAVVSLPTAFTMSAFALIGTVIMLAAIFAVDRQVVLSLKEQLQMMQVENFKNRELEWRRFSGFRHDMKNHLICLSKLLENGKTEQATSYMRNLTDTVKQFDSPLQTGNDYADALLRVKYAEALAAKITVSIEMAIPPQGFIEPVDLCCILSNAFDNAIAACKHVREGEKWITARAFIKQGQFVIVIKNSKPSYVAVVDGEVFPKKITADHGLGLDNVKAVVQKYGGVLDLSADEAFCFSVLLPKLLL